MDSLPFHSLGSEILVNSHLHLSESPYDFIRSVLVFFFFDTWWKTQEKLHLFQLPVSSSPSDTFQVSTYVMFLLSHKSQDQVGNKKICNKQFKAWQCTHEHMISCG